MKYWPTIILLFLPFIKGWTQDERLSGTTYNPAFENETSPVSLKKAAGADTLQLPFFDDFSARGAYMLPSVYPSTERWTDKKVYINQKYGMNPVSVGVATFDILDSLGRIYDNASPTPFGADTLTSKAIALQNAENVYLSFYYQPGGNAEVPDLKDSLVLDFFTVENKWVPIWAVTGADKLVDKISETYFATSGNIKKQSGTLQEQSKKFQFVILPVAAAGYKHNGFRFRFRNKATITADANWDDGTKGNCDLWHLDYIRLDKNRNANDSIFQDVAITEVPTSLLVNYTAMPWTHFIETNARDNEVNNTIRMGVRNNDEIDRNIGVRYYFRERYSGQNAKNFGGSKNITAFTSEIFLDDFFGDLIVQRPDSAVFELKAVIQGNPPYDYRGNDTIEFYQRFTNYYAYDDGSAEAGYGFYGNGTKNAKLAYRFTAYKPDSLYGVYMFFNRTVEDANQKAFRLTVWDEQDGKPGNIIYQSTNNPKPIFTLGHNGFALYPFEQRLMVDGPFYVGWVQTVETFLNIGFDKNTNSRTNIFYNTNGAWTNTSFEGSVMIRPIFKTYLSTGIKPIQADNSSLQVFPNPVRNEFSVRYDNPEQLIGAQVQLFDISGRMVFSSIFEGSPLSAQGLKPGIYLIRITGNGILLQSKLLKINE